MKCMVRNHQNYLDREASRQKSERVWNWLTGTVALLTMGFLIGTVIGVQI